jgi:hypothetical protein
MKSDGLLLIIVIKVSIIIRIYFQRYILPHFGRTAPILTEGKDVYFL